MNKATHEYLMQHINYSPETGEFFWKKSPAPPVLAGSRAGWLDSCGYRQISLQGRAYLAHRLAFLYMTGKPPEREVDHANRIRDDNRWCNLRSCDRHQNTQNASVRKDNRLGIRGVWATRYGSYEAQVIANKTKHRRKFKSVEEAAEWVLEKRKELHGDFSTQP
tara:strand:+ start:12415 stop:12906 length:492 start_codon:yes stop_codon:yes gene_type:complete